MDDKPTELAEPADQASGSRGTKLMLYSFTVVGLVIGWLIGAAVVPRWWAQRVGDIIGGRLLFGSTFGIVVGLFFTVVPLLVLALGWRLRGGVKRGLLFVALAVVLAAPNLATLGIVVGSGNAAHAGERILDVDGPGFRGGSTVGAVLGALVFVALQWLLFSRRRNKNKAKRLEADLASRDEK